MRGNERLNNSTSMRDQAKREKDDAEAKVADWNRSDGTGRNISVLRHDTGDMQCVQEREDVTRAGGSGKESTPGTALARREQRPALGFGKQINGSNVAHEEPMEKGQRKGDEKRQDKRLDAIAGRDQVLYVPRANNDIHSHRGEDTTENFNKRVHRIL